MSRPLHESRIRIHVVAGGFPPGTPAGHDMDYARLRLLGLLGEAPRVACTVASDFADVERWLPGSACLVTYVAGPFPDAAQTAAIEAWLAGGGRWLALHGTSGGKAVRVEHPSGTRKQMVRMAHHDTLGGFFLNHPPVRRFAVRVADRDHPITAGVPETFETADELYLVELRRPAETRVLLTTELEGDPSPPDFGFVYERDTSALADGRTRAIGFVREAGDGGVAYLALGHTHSPGNCTQRYVDASVVPSGETPPTFRGSWEHPAFERLLRNAIGWGTAAA